MIRATPAPAGLLTPRRIAAGVAAAVVVGAAVVTGVGRVAGYTALVEELRDATWAWLGLCAVGQVLVFAGYAGVFRSALDEDGAALDFVTAVQVALAGFALTQLVAAGGAAGLAFTWWILARRGLGRRDAAVRLIGLNTAVYAVFALVAVVGAAAATVTAAAPLGFTVPWLVGVPLVVVAARWFTDPARRDRFIGSASGTVPPRARWREALGVGVAAAAWVRERAGHPRRRGVFVAAGVYWAGDLLSLWAGVRAFGPALRPEVLVVAYTTGYLAQSVPLPFIATGGVDAATTFVLGALGVPVDTALLGVVAHRVFAFWLPIAPGVWSAWRLAGASAGRSVTT